MAENGAENGNDRNGEMTPEYCPINGIIKVIKWIYI